MLSLCPSGSKLKRRLGPHLHSTKLQLELRLNSVPAVYISLGHDDARAQFSTKPKTKRDF